MPRNGSGTYVLPAGNPVSSGTTIQSSWANTLTGDLGSALTQSLSRDGQAAMTGPLPMGGQDIQNAVNITASGTLSVGALVTTGSSLPTNGWYLPSANTLGVATASTQRGTINATGNWTVIAPTSGISVSISAASAAQALNLNAVTASWTGIKFQENAVDKWSILEGISASGTLSFRSHGTAVNQLEITGGGNVTIAAPVSGAHTITGLAGTNGTVITNASGSVALFTGVFGQTNNPRVQVVATEASALIDINWASSAGAANGTLSLNGTAWLTLSANRNVTINAPSSGTTLALISAATSAQLSATDGTVTYLLQTVAGPRLFLGTSSNHGVSLYTNANERIAIAAAGGVIINAPSSGVALAVTGVVDTIGVNIQGAASSNAVVLNVVGGATQTNCTMIVQSQGTGRECIRLVTPAATDPYIKFNTAANTGANTLTPTWTNFPGTGGSKNPTSWVPVLLGGTTGWIPVWT